MAKRGPNVKTLRPKEAGGFGRKERGLWIAKALLGGPMIAEDGEEDGGGSILVRLEVM